MNKVRKLLIVLLAMVMAVGSLSMNASAATQKAVVSVSVGNVTYGVVTINKGKTFKLEPVVKVTGNTSKGVTYSSSNKAVATVSMFGTITAKSNGCAAITVTSKADKTKKAVIKVYVGKPVTKVTLDKKTASVYLGQKFSLKASVNGDAAFKNVAFSSSDKSVAYVDKEGNVYVRKPGTVKIIATAKDNSGVKAGCMITVKSPVKSVDVLNVKFNKVAIKKGETFTLKSSISVVDGTSKEFVYKTSDATVATVDATGKIKALKNGSALITVKSKVDPSKLKKIKVYVGNPVSEITLPEEVSVSLGQTISLDAKTNANAVYGVLGYKSCNTDIATVDKNGVVTAVEEGTAKIKVYSMDNSNILKICNVTVVDRAPEKEGYNLVFEDNFSGDALDESKWNYEVHAPGWVNAELQEYVAGTDNTYVEDGKLVINPEKDADGNITSGRINTLGKANFKYGYFEARAKVPTGKGYLPAFWLMAADESVYGQWPRCGEIDIMEVMGHETNKTYSTIHYGNPHGQSQVGYVLPEGSFADGYHTYGCDWEPGSIKFYVDGQLVHEVNDWYSAQDGETPITYPAPFDQEFYIILNLAVGGSWVGYPDDTTSYDEDYRVDYVRVYQKDEYDENVERPVEDVVIRDPDANGNYIINGDFSDPDKLDGTGAWQFLTAQGGKGSAAVVGNTLEVKSEEQGTETYSVQVVQAELPLIQGKKYEVSFDAYADEERTITTGISAPKLNYMRYFGDEKVELTTRPQKYTYTFDMTKATDAHARMEFNLGKAGSTATVHIDNVVVKVIDDIEIDDTRTPRADGNYIYNGKFQEGTNRLGDWEIVGNDVNIEKYEVTPLSDNRKFHIITKDCEAADAVSLKQTKVPYLTNAKYKFMVDAKCATGTATINVWLNGSSYPVEISNEMDTYTLKFETGENVVSDDFKIDLGVNQDVYLDNVTIVEDSLIVNGSFNAGLAGYEVYKNSGTDATAVVDSLTEDNAFDITIKDTGSLDWEIQLKQNNVELIKDQWYKLSFDVKSDYARAFKYTIQRDGSADDNWVPYAGDNVIDLAGDGNYTTVEKVFKMKNSSDAKAILSFSMGAVNGVHITTPHRICIDNISLDMVDAPETPGNPSEEDTELLVNPSFTDTKDPWVFSQNEGGEAEATFADGVATITVANPGTVNYGVQLAQNDLTFEEGADYVVSFNVKSDVARKISWSLLDPADGYKWYTGEDLDITAETTIVEVPFTATATTESMSFQINLGFFEGACDPSTVEISGLSIVKVAK